ncbi:MAG: alpha/beta hydrolase [Pseudomonadales bacterium]|nr:alpha/beta hydrolase [Pseudomonadales bacterium]
MHLQAYRPATPQQDSYYKIPPPRLVSLTANDFTSELLGGGSQGLSLLALSTGDATGKTTLKCGVDVYYIQFATVDGQGLPATSSGAVMVPTGATGCNGTRPIVEYAHGTNFDHNYNIANLADSSNPANGESLMIAAMYAANGYIVVAPNYVGYDSSTTTYHPYLVKAQQAADMINALKSARSALPYLLTATGDNGKLYLTGYSQGGYVALAAEQAMENQGMTVTASAPGSGPYALSAFVDYIFMGHPDLGSSRLGVILSEGYQGSYGNVYSSPYDLFTRGNYVTMPYADLSQDQSSPVQLYTTPMFSSTLPSLSDVTAMPGGASASTLPSDFSSLSLANSTTPPPGSSYLNPVIWNELFSTSSPSDYASMLVPLYKQYTGSGYLMNQTFRANYLADAYANMDNLFASTNTDRPNTAATLAFRQDLIKNDLRGYVPQSPTMLCGGHADPMVFYPINTLVMQTEWGNPTGTRLSLDVDNLTSTSLTPMTGLPAPVAGINDSGSNDLSITVPRHPGG